jgi:hypothetical protein
MDNSKITISENKTNGESNTNEIVQAILISESNNLLKL